jgi:hypothetical protein
MQRYKLQIKKININFMATYLPISDSDKVTWLNNFKLKIANYATQLGFTAAEVTSIQNDAVYFQFVVQQLDAYKQLTLGMTSFKNTLKTNKQQQATGNLPTLAAPATIPTSVAAGIFTRVGTYALRIKRSAAYTPAIGQDLGIVVPNVVFDPSTFQPDLEVKLEAGRPHLKWTKSSSDSIQLYVDRNLGDGFVPLAHTVKTEYLDVAQVPTGSFTAQWSYKAKYKIGDDEVGMFSPVITIVVFKV